MEDEEGYTALYIQSKRPRRVSPPGAASPAGKQDVLQSPRCHQIILWAASFVIVLLVAAVIALVLQLEAEKGQADTGRHNSTCPLKCNTPMDNFLSFLRSRLCNQSQGNSKVNSSCKLCPAHWHIYRDKCYWPSTDVKSWNESQEDCSAKRSQLVVIQGKEELEFLKQITQDMHTYWAGLFMISPGKKWMWITGSPFDQNLFQETKHFGEEYCGAIKNRKITSDTCKAVFRWVCQKDSILI